MTNRLLCCAIAAFTWLTCAPPCGADDSQRPAAPQSPVAPVDTLQHFVTHPDCRIELVAAEPDVMSPIQVAFDPDGRMWVMEYSDYPNGPAEGEPGRSRIRILTDDNGDGRFENPQIFVDKLLFATGLAFWRDGVIVTSQGSVDFLRDTDGDLRCDERETWFKGFAEENPQLRANAPTFAVDNHFYIASGLRGGQVIAAREEWAKDAQPVNLSGRDFRFDPVTGKYESVTGPSQFGIAIDDFGNRFTCDNRHPCTHVVIEDRYAQRNPKLAIPSLVQDVAQSGESSRVFPISKFWTTSNLHEGQFTAACGICNYRGTALPPKFYGQHFVCDPTGNFVHCEILTPQGATFTSKPEREGVEFLASPDTWFRPVNLTVGPDGALYVVDMYRAVIEHPEWMPAELRNRPDLLLGVDRGRIYRIVQNDAATAHPVLEASLRTLPSSELVDLLGSPNAWQRETAQRLLFEKLSVTADPETVAALNSAWRLETAEGRTRARWLLYAIGQLDAKAVEDAFGDPDPRASGATVQFAESLDCSPDRANKIARIAATMPDGRQAFDYVLGLSAFPWTEQLPDLLAKAACKHGRDPWMVTAVTLTAREQCADVLASALMIARTHDDRVGTGAVVRGLSAQAGASAEPQQIGKLLSLGADTQVEVYRELVLGLSTGTARSGRAWETVSASFEPAVREKLDGLYAESASLALSGGSDVESALAILRLAPWEAAREPLMTLAQGENLTSRLSAINSLAGRYVPEVDAYLIEGFAGQTPAVKPALLSAIFASPERINKLFDEIEAGNIAPRELDVTRTGQLLNHPDAAIKARAQALLASNISSDREQVFNDYKAVLSLEGDPRRGREIFTRTCVQCHKIGGLGVNVAPEISDLGRTQTHEQILLSILDPNRAIDNNYFSYSVLENSGTVHTGVIAAETATSVTLKQAEGKQVTILRSDIDELKSNGISLMPVGVEKDIDKQQMADLLAFIKNWRYLDGAVPGLGDRN